MQISCNMNMTMNMTMAEAFFYDELHRSLGNKCRKCLLHCRNDCGWWSQGPQCEGEHGDEQGNIYGRSMPSFTIAAVAIVAISVVQFSVRR